MNTRALFFAPIGFGLVYASGIIPHVVGAAIIGLFGIGWVALGWVALRRER